METTKESSGALLQGGDADARREAARMLGAAKTPAKAAASRENGRKGGKHEFTDETIRKLRASQKARREREALAKAAMAVAVNTSASSETSDRKPGRPRTRPIAEPGEKRGRGRPPGSPNKPKGSAA